MMKDGKLIWSRRSEGDWFTSAHDDEYRWYIAQRSEGGWSVVTQGRFGSNQVGLGWHIYLKDAKRAADKHHHQKIRESDNDNLKAYIERYPIEQLDSTNL
jgi:hypothetical protein